jgi:hypothetical protein
MTETSAEVPAVERKAVCNGCWFNRNDDHERCRDALCECGACRATAKDGAAYGAFGNLPRWTIDKDTTRWEDIRTAMAFRKPNGDVLAVMRSVTCPTCSQVAYMVLADGDVVSYVRTRHASCDMMPAPSRG